MKQKAGEKQGDLLRRLGLFDATMMMVGIVIGSGIFLTTGIMAQHLPSPGWILVAWSVGGLLTLAGALTLAELGAAMPEAGGLYVYLREAYGPIPAFLFGWILFFISMGGSIAALAVGFAEYFGYFFPSLATDVVLFSVDECLPWTKLPFTLTAGQIIAVAAILILSFFNIIGVGWGKTIQNGLTLTKLCTILIFIIMGFILFSPGRGGRITFRSDGKTTLLGFGVALVAVSWAFDGWHNLNYIAGEIRRPRRNLPLALLLGTCIITGCYLLVNIVYLTVLPIKDMQGVVRIAERTSTVFLGRGGANVISAVVLVSTFGALNGAIFVAPRVYYAMAKDGVFFRSAGKIHPRFRTPHVGLILQALWASILTLTGRYEQLFTYVMFITFLFWIAAAASVFRLRKIRPDLERPYKTRGYPFVPLIFIASATAIMLNTFFEKPVESIAGFFIACLGLPAYFTWRRKFSKISVLTESADHAER